VNDTTAAQEKPFSPLPNIAMSAGAELLRAVVDEVRTMQLGWSMLGEESQNRIIDRLRIAVHEAVSLTVRRCAAADYEHLVAEIESLTVKDGAKAVLSLVRGSTELHALLDRVGSRAVLVFTEPDKFTSGMELLRGDADQPQLPLE